MDESFVDQEGFLKALRHRDDLQRIPNVRERFYKDVIGGCIKKDCNGFIWIEEKWATVETSYPGPNIYKDGYLGCHCDRCEKEFNLDDPEITKLIEDRFGKTQVQLLEKEKVINGCTPKVQNSISSNRLNVTLLLESCVCECGGELLYRSWVEYADSKNKRPFVFSQHCQCLRCGSCCSPHDYSVQMEVENTISRQS